MTGDLAPFVPRIPAMTESAIGKVRDLEKLRLGMPQVAIRTDHVIHAGLYARTVFVPAGVMITGVLVKIDTVLIVEGDVSVYLGGAPLRLTGYNVLMAEANRKQAFVAISDVHLTMMFKTNAKTVTEAEREFTDEVDLLLSRREAVEG